jgi:NADP-dependent 3-hydroxy acid dehydrogenase YdfG
MKITITGHTSGIGKAMYEGFVAQGHEVVGINRSSTPNLSTDKGIMDVASLSEDSDMIIINAYDITGLYKTMGFAQTILLNRMFSLWKGKDKTIVVIGSRSSDVHHGSVNPYAIHKIAIDETVKQLRNIQPSMPHILNLKPSYVDTPQVAHISNAKKMNPIDVFEICDWALKNKNYIFDISFESK